MIVACAAEDLDEILGNIIDNAAKGARSRVKIHVGQIAATRTGNVAIIVEDDGPGMPEGDRERVFQAGERLDEQTPGLGRAIMRDITELNGGRVWIETAKPGGAAVHLELPIVTPV